MDLTPDKIEDAALSLSREQRARLVERLVASLESETHAEEAWAIEIRQRVDDLRASKVEAIDGDLVFEELKKYYR